MSIRLQLLLVALCTLVLPWAGFQYARELESTLRGSQEQALLARAETIANSLSASPQRVFRNPADHQRFDAGQGDLYVFPLGRQPLLDGYREDWDVRADPTPLPSEAGLRGRWQAGMTERYLYLYVEIEAPHFHPEPLDADPERDHFDHVDVVIDKPDGQREAFYFATSAPGLIAAQSVVRRDDGTVRSVQEPRVQAYWLQTSHGYHVEARVPLSQIGAHLWLSAVDGADPAHYAGLLAPPLAGDSGGIGRAPAHGGRLFFASTGLDETLATFVRNGTRATVVDANGLTMGSTGGLTADPEREGKERDAFGRLIGPDLAALPAREGTADHLAGPHLAGALAGRPTAVWLRADGGGDSILAAAAPLVYDGATHGAVVLEQAGAALDALRDRALSRLLRLTLGATAVAVVFVFGMATWISVRIGRLRVAADSAVGSDGRIRLDMPEASRQDELGALARSFERLLVRLNEHTQYLRTLGGKLSHELRTPMTIVRSSLDNLESESLTENQRPYLRRAREGVQRLQSILSALGAAARVEESIKQAERVNFELGSLLNSAVAGYQDSFRRVQIELETPPDDCPLRGGPELIVQLLDKLIENAVDFCPPGGRIGVRLTRSVGHYVLEVANDGPPIPEAMLGRLFESLFEQRTGHDDKPHFGLGLYIVRLIAEFHGGTVAADNRREASGARFTVRLPII